MNTARELEQLKGTISIKALEIKAEGLASDIHEYGDTITYGFKDGSLVRFLTLSSFDIGRIMQVQDNRV